jgi:glycosyltransferase involved in cell wall biosynthesis
VKVFVGLPSYNRADVLRLCLSSFSGSKLVKGFIVVADSASEGEAQHYAEVVNEVKGLGFEVLHDIRVGRRGSARARNRVLEMAKERLSDDDVLVLYDDDYLYPGDHALTRALCLLRDVSIGFVGGRVVNLRRRRVDPDFALNVPRLADALTRLTGFIVLDTKHGPREVDFTTPPMATKVKVLKRGIKYDESYEGTGYREESDLQKQVRDLGLKIVFEPRFYAYHLAVEKGGNRYSDLEDRMYWKWRNHTYFMSKWRYPLYKKVLSYAILTAYAVLNGPPAVKGIVRAVRG